MSGQGHKPPPSGRGVVTGRSIMTVAKILARQQGWSEDEWRFFTKEAAEIIDALPETAASIPHEGLVNERDRAWPKRSTYRTHS